MVFKNIENTDLMLKKISIKKTDDMSEKDVEDFCEWVCAKATRLGFDVRVIDEDKKVD
jgi:hypothetical protein|tara:strand:+ start:103 stop:276 length:174 start_codon:yes stop_codon:yes gene_type:complete